jgi:hypothetical protein
MFYRYVFGRRKREEGGDFKRKRDRLRMVGSDRRTECLMHTVHRVRIRTIGSLVTSSLIYRIPRQ